MAVADTRVDFHQVPVKALQEPTKFLIGSLLNPPKVIPSDDGFPRDWRGLAHLVGLDSSCVRAATLSENPTEKVLGWWKDGTLGLLQDYLGRLDRWDIVDDTAQRMEVDAIEYGKNLTRASTSVDGIDEDLDKMILTKDDVIRLDQGLEPQKYHAYLLYADEDVHFAKEIVDQMENKYKLKLCLRDRDLVGGHMFAHKAIMKLIADRCHRLIVILTDNFLKSEEANKFFVTFAQALGIDQKKRKVIPVIYQRCSLPTDLSYYFTLDYTRSGHLWNFWEKLRDSIHTPTSQKNGYSSTLHLSQSEPVMKEMIPPRKIVSAPIESEFLEIEKEMPWIGSQNNISQYSIQQNKRCVSNPSLYKKSFSVSFESVKGKTLKMFGKLRREKKAKTASQC